MPSFVLTDVNTYVHGYDVTGDSNSVTLSSGVDVQDATTFGSGGYRTKRGGLKDVTAEVQGFWGSTPDSEAFSGLGVVDRVVTFAPQGTTPGNIAYFCQAGNFTYQQFGGIGDMTPFTLGLEGSNPVGLVRGALTHKGSVSSVASFGTGVNLGAGAAGRYLYVAFHTFTAGTTLSVQVEQSTTQGGTYTAVAPAVITGITTTGGRWMVRQDATALTGPWYRLKATACTGTFTVAASIGIQ